MADVRSFVGGNYLFTLGGVKCGFVKSVDGGGVSAEVFTEHAGTSYFPKKHIGGPRYEDFTLQIGFSMDKAVYDWISDSWQMQYQRKDGSIVACDYNLEAKSEREFLRALITETGIPACDGASKEPGYITLKFSPELTRVKKASGKESVPAKSMQKLWLPRDFKLDIDKLDCTRVSRIEPFTVKQSTVHDDAGDARNLAEEPGKIEFPNLKISVSDVNSHTWREWHESFVIKGNNDETFEKHGRLILLAPNLTTELAEIKFFGLGIFNLVDSKSDGSHDQIKRCTAELYCERMEFNYLHNT
jgi:hypothetical protein